MSRYSVVRETREVVIGWDRPLATFFCQVYDLGGGLNTSEELLAEDELLLDIGTYENPISTIYDLRARLAGFDSRLTDIVDRFYDDLHTDQTTNREPREVRA